MEAGYDPVTLAVVTNTDQYDIKVQPLQEVNRQDTLMVVTQLEDNHMKKSKVFQKDFYGAAPLLLTRQKAPGI